MTARISLLLPTRGRPKLALRFLESAAARSDAPDFVEAVLRVDEDDPQSHNLGTPGITVRTIVGPRATMGEYNTACLRGSRGEIMVLANDDVIIRTQGWDRRLRELDASIPDRIYLAYPNDLFKGRSLCAFPIVSRRTCELLAEPFPAEYRGAFIDYHLLDIFKRLERRGQRRLLYLEDVVFEHMHFRTGKGEHDQTYASRNRFSDDGTFLRLRDKRSGAAARLSGVPDLGLGTAPAKGDAEAFLRATILDDELPFAWRLRLFLWFLARRVAKWFLPVRTAVKTARPVGIAPNKSNLAEMIQQTYESLCQSDVNLARLSEDVLSGAEAKAAFIRDVKDEILRRSLDEEGHAHVIVDLLCARQAARVSVRLGLAGEFPRVGLCCPSRAYRYAFGDIDARLRAKRARVIKMYSEYINDEFERSEGAFFCGFDIARRISNADVVLSATLTGDLAAEPKKILFVHDIFDSPLGDEAEFRELARLFDAFFMPSTLAIDSLRRVFEPIARPDVPGSECKRHVVIRGGYPRLDQNIAYFNRHAVQEPTIIYAPTMALPEWESFVSVPRWVEGVVRTLLDGFPQCKLIFRPHPHSLNRKEVQAVIAKFSPHSRFETDLRGTDYMPSYSRAAVMVSDTSGTAYTYAFTTGRPIVFFSPNEAQARALNPGVRYFDYRDRVGLVAENYHELRRCVSAVLANPGPFRESSFGLRDEVVFNVGRACEYFVSIFDHLVAGTKIPGAIYFRT